MTMPYVFDRRLLARRRARALRRGLVDDALLPRVADDLAERLSAVLREFPMAVDIGTPGAAVRDGLRGNGRIGTLHHAAEALEGAQGGGSLVVDLERLPFAPASLNLVVSALALHWVNDLPGTLVQIRRSLKPDGLFMAAMVGGDTLTELRQSMAQAEADVYGGISPRIAPFVDVKDLGQLLQRAGFALPVTDVDRLHLRYASIEGLFRDLKALAATNILAERRRTPIGKRLLARLAEIYAGTFADPDGRLRATLDIVWLSGWAPHESQQKPLAPGSAKAHLAEALAAMRPSDKPL